MSQQKIDALDVGLSEAEKDDLEKMIGDFHRDRPRDAPGEAGESIQAQLDSLSRRLADLVDIMRLSHQKSELLNQRLDAVIAALKKGRML